MADIGMADKQYKVYIDEVEPEGSDGRKWKPGFKYTFPYLSCAALFLILGICCGIIAVTYTSDGKDAQSWDSHSASILHYTKTVSIPVNVWISGFVFFAGKLVALIFAEAVTIAWWVRAMKGQHLRQLAHDFDASRSITAVLKTPKLFSWICLGSIAFTGFSGLGMILQKSTDTVAEDRSHFNHSMTTTHATRMPYGWSGIYDGFGLSLPSYSKAIGQIIHDYQQKASIQIKVQGCNETAGSVCETSFRGIGFQFDCSASTGTLKPHPGQLPNQTLWGVGVNWYNAPFPRLHLPAESAAFKASEDLQKIDLVALWKNETGCHGRKLVIQNCVLTPAIVDYPIRVADNLTTLRPLVYQNSGDVQQHGMLNVPSDSIVRLLPNASAKTESMSFSGNPTTWGGVAMLFADLWASQIRYWQANDNAQEAHFEASKLFAATYQLKSKWVHPKDIAFYPKGACFNKFDSPMEDIANGIRDIMFRISVATARGDIEDVFLASNARGSIKTQAPPTQNLTDRASSYHAVVSVYQTKYRYLWLGIGLMILALAAILPLFWDFWKLGRKVSLSPLELATALHTSSIHEKAGGQEANVFDVVRENLGGNSLSNADTKELVTVMGDIKVKYGQVAPSTLGLAVEGTVDPPNHGALYR